MHRIAPWEIDMNLFRPARIALVLVAAQLMVGLLPGVSWGGVGVGFGGIGISVGPRNGQRGNSPGQRGQAGRKPLNPRRNSQDSRGTSSTATNRAPSTTTRPKTTASTTKPTAASATAAAAAKKSASAVAPKLPFEVVDVRLVDVGELALGEGPRFRVVLKNVTAAAMKQPREVMISAGISDTFSADLPTAVQELKILGPGESAPVDLRLPAEAMTMAYPGRDEPSPFSTLFVQIGGRKNVLGSSSITKLAVLPLSEIHMTDLAITPPAAKEVPVGQPLELQGEGLGPEQGTVQLTVGEVKMDLEVLAWTELGIAVQMPKLALKQPTKVQLQIVRADGEVAKPMALTAVLPAVTAVAKETVPFPATTPVKTVESPAKAQPKAPAGIEASSPANADSNNGEPVGLAQAFGEVAPAPSGSGK
jgi:hypothetical protein